ncbi:MAG: flagellar hook-associated protein FlgK [Lachnospiraceae bacterium]
MSSTFFGLSIAGSGLRAANAALNTTANNISNSDTQGYSRQQVVQQAANALRTFTTYGCAGAGVETIAIERIRDEFYDTKYRENETRYGEYSEKLYYTNMIEDYFTDDGKTGFNTVFTALKTSLQEVLKNAGSSTSKQEFISTATKLTEYFNNLSANMENLQKDVNAEIKVKVDAINSLSQEIASIDKQINVVELTGAKANELRDERDKLVDELSKIVDVSVSETPIYDSNNPDRETGAHRFIVRIAGGQILVDGNDRNELEVRARESDYKVNQSDIVGLYDIYWVGGDQFNTTNSSMGGELAGLLQLRDGNNGENFKGTVAEVDTTNNTAKIEVTAEYLTDLNKCNLSNSGSINIGNQLFTYSGWTYSMEVDADGNAKYYYTFQLNDDVKISESKVGRETSTGSTINYQGIPYYMSQMNEWVRLFSQAFNSILESGYTDDGEVGTLMFTADYIDGTQGKFKGENDVAAKSIEAIFSKTTAEGVYSLTSTEDTYYRLTATNVNIAKALTANAELLATKKAESQTDGESQYDNISALSDMFTDKKQMSFRGCDAGEFLTCLLGDVSLNANSAKTFSTTYETMENTLQNQRLSIFGVDQDEEALNLVQYQNSYTLASKMISTFAEIYDRLILETGV